MVALQIRPFFEVMIDIRVTRKGFYAHTNRQRPPIIRVIVFRTLQTQTNLRSSMTDLSIDSSIVG